MRHALRSVRPAVLALPVAALPLLAACASSGGGPGSGGSAVPVTAGDSRCDVARTDLQAGSTTFSVRNTGSSVTEVYVYGKDGDAFTKVVGEVENIGPGTSRELEVGLTAGTYELACKPGQRGDGIRSTLTVTGGSSAGAATSTPRTTAGSS